MSFISNTTPTPNWLYNGEMKKMSDTDLRIVLVITRKTLGWEINKKNGMRKFEDWISIKQFMEITGKSNRAIATAIQNCINQGWVEAYDKNGNFLNTPKRRARSKIYYRLGDIFLSKLSDEESSPDTKSGEVISKSGELNDINLVKKVHNTKETITKETIQKEKPSELKLAPLNNVINLFKELNPSFERLFKNTTQRASLERLILKFGQEKVKKMIKFAAIANTKPYAPTITTPLQLEENLGKLHAFFLKERSKSISKGLSIFK